MVTHAFIPEAFPIPLGSFFSFLKTLIYLFGCIGSCDMQDLSVTACGISFFDQRLNQAPCIGSAVFATGPPGKSPKCNSYGFKLNTLHIGEGERHFQDRKIHTSPGKWKWIHFQGNPLNEKERKGRFSHPKKLLPPFLLFLETDFCLIKLDPLRH